ncbi:MAG: NADH-quinone oxidoreductase subunit C [Bryobacteraceae bacterium]
MNESSPGIHQMDAEQKPQGTPKPAADGSAAPWDDDLTARLAELAPGQIAEFSTYLGQNFLVCAPEAVISILEYLKLEEDFDYLVDITAVDYPTRPDRFDLVYILYSHPHNRRIRIKTRIPEGYRPESAVAVHRTADWLEREVFDMFGIEFANHPNMQRILLPEDWQGHPLRKDYPILRMDHAWVRENLGIESGQ